MIDLIDLVRDYEHSQRCESCTEPNSKQQPEQSTALSYGNINELQNTD